ncbi:helix-turn-helix domain-containing protein [Rhizobium leguminosarum]|nr:helix-turn-helix domain-containing protein [Rhizobium leguminosarum]
MENPSYYAIIPANVRYSSINPNAKLLYGEITALCFKSGVCWASNGYFAALYDTSPRAVQRWISELKDAGFLALCGHPNNPSTRGMKLASPPDKIVVGSDESVMGTPDKIVTHNNTSLNTTTSHKTNEPKASSRALPARSIAILLEDLAEIPTDLFTAAWEKHRTTGDVARDEWAKFRNHHISARSKHTRVDLCWDTWCRNAAKWQRGSAAAAAGAAGQGGGKRYDPVAAAKSRAMAELFGDSTEGHGRSAAEADSDACPFGGGAETVGTSFVDVSPSHETRQRAAGGADGSDSDRHE